MIDDEVELAAKRRKDMEERMGGRRRHMLMHEGGMDHDDEMQVDERRRPK